MPLTAGWVGQSATLWPRDSDCQEDPDGSHHGEHDEYGQTIASEIALIMVTSLKAPYSSPLLGAPDRQVGSGY